MRLFILIGISSHILNEIQTWLMINLEKSNYIGKTSIINCCEIKKNNKKKFLNLILNFDSVEIEIPKIIDDGKNNGMKIIFLFILSNPTTYSLDLVTENIISNNQIWEIKYIEYIKQLRKIEKTYTPYIYIMSYDNWLSNPFYRTLMGRKLGLGDKYIKTKIFTEKNFHLKFDPFFSQLRSNIQERLNKNIECERFVKNYFTNNIF